MSKASTKADRELAIFEKFVSRSELKVISGSIECRQPPEPDIICKIEGVGSVRFELTEACAPEFAEAVNNPRPEAHACFGGDVTKETLVKKFAKRYPVEEPIELLLYTDGASGKPDFLLKYDIEDALAEVESQFQRIWLMADEIHEYPQLVS